LLEQLVDQRGLAVVNVRDDGDIADVHDSKRPMWKTRLIDSAPRTCNALLRSARQRKNHQRFQRFTTSLWRIKPMSGAQGAFDMRAIQPIPR
jgi:hypothetical protein